MTFCCVLFAGLVFFNIPDGPAAAYQRGCVLFFTMLLFELLPFCYGGSAFKIVIVLKTPVSS